MMFNTYRSLILIFLIFPSSFFPAELNQIEEASELKEVFLELGGTWWHESNRMIPIGIFLRQEMEKFKNVLMIMNTKDVSVKLGPVTSLANLAMKRSKRKSVQLVRKPK